MKIFCDLDGVLSDWAAAVSRVVGRPISIKTEMDGDEWNAILDAHRQGEKLWENLELLPDAMELWNYIKPLYPILLTATGAHNSQGIPNYFRDVSTQKRRWVSKYLGPEFLVLTTKDSKEKGLYANSYSLLIDDRPISIESWENEGGIGILHTSAQDTIQQLIKLGIKSEKPIITFTDADKLY